MKKNRTLKRVLYEIGILMLAFVFLNTTNAKGANNGSNISVSELLADVVIKGKVFDKQNEPLIGVSIKVKGTTRGTITDLNGQFSIDVSPNSILEFSYIGYKTKSVQIQNQKVLNIVLDEENKMLTEVVVTALGIKREEKALGYAVQKVGGEGLQTVKGVDVGVGLTGKVSGLMVKNSSDFAYAPEIKLRGESPLLVIDGITYGNMSLRDIPNDDIESIEVLKGATASALYGYRGANGAIMVTTKQGSKNKGLSIVVNSGSMFSAGYLAIPKVQSTYGREINTATNTYSRTAVGAWGVPMEGQDIIQWDPISKTMKSMPYLPIGKDNFKNFLVGGHILNNNISVIQQGQLGSVRASATWVNNKGTYPNSIYNKYTFTLGGDIKLDKFTLSSTMTFNKQHSPNIGFNGYRAYDPMYSLLLLSAPDFDVRQYKDYWLVKNESQNNSYTTSNNNPYFDLYQRIHTLDRDIFNGMLSLDYKMTPWLKGMARVGFDTYTNSQDVSISQGSYTGGGIATVIGGGKEVWGESTKGSYNTGLSRGYSITGDFILTVQKQFGDFNLNGLAGGTLYYTHYNAIEARTQGGLSVPGFYSLKASINTPYIGTATSKQQVNSLYAKAEVGWKSMLFAEGTLRNDWSSTLPSSTRSYLYPSVSASFIPTEILPKQDWLSYWKVRGSWTTSKSPAGIYEINNTYSVTANAWGTMSSASLPTSIRNNDVSPTASETIEFGTTVNFLKNRISLDVTHFSRRYYDYIVYSSISQASGYSSKYQNSKEEKTRKGVEISAKFTPVKMKDLQWDCALNWSTSVIRFTKLDEQFSWDVPWVKVGKRADYNLVNDYLKDPQGNMILVNGLPQYSKYASVDGYNDPDWIWGFSTSLRYKNWTFNISMDGRVGGKTSSFTEAYMWRNGVHPKSVTPERYLDATKPGTSNYLGQGVKVVSGSVSYDTYGNIVTDTRTFAPNDHYVTYKNYINSLHKNFAWGGYASPLDIMSTTFFKIRDISVTYNVPQKWCEKLGSKGIAVSAVGQNVLLWAKDFKYSDPDGGSENLTDPSIRYVGFNIQMKF